MALPVDLVPRPQSISAYNLSDDSLGARLFKEGYAFNFFQAVRLLELLFPNRAPVGFDGPEEKEIVHFRAHQALTFPASQIYSVDPPLQKGAPATMVVTFFGMTGPSGVLPRHYTEMLMRLEREAKGPERTALRDWFDLFNHRLLSHFYRAWAKYRLIIPFERQDYLNPEPDSFTQAMYSFIGVGMPQLRNRLRIAFWDSDNAERPERPLAQINDLTLLYYGGLLAQRPRSACALKALVQDFFQVPVEVKQFQGQWLQIEAESQSRLTEGEANNALGINTVAGERVWDVLGRFRLRLGPLTYTQFAEFIPDRAVTPRHKAFFLLSHLVRFFAGTEFSFDVQVVLRAPDIPECQLVDSEESTGALLGWNTWLQSQEAEFNASDAIFEGEEVNWINEAERPART